MSGAATCVMSDCRSNPVSDVRLVGDPVDVVTGASIAVQGDFQLPGSLPIYWNRYYSSARTATAFALGWGHSHEYERSLQFDLDGIRYIGPLGKAIGFPPLTGDGDRTTAGGLTLTRLRADAYRVSAAGEPEMEFRFGRSQTMAPLAALVSGLDHVRFEYTPAGHLRAIIDSTGRVIRVDADAAGRPVRLVRVGTPSIPDRTLVSYVYDASGDLVEGTDAYGHAFSLAYDPAHRLVRHTDRRGYSFHSVYDAAGRCVRSYGEDGRYEVRLEYRPVEQRTVVTRGDGGEWTYFYDDAGTVTAVLDPRGGLRRFVIGEDGRVTAEVDPNGNETEWIYSGAGAFLSKRSPLGDSEATPAVPLRPDQLVHRVPEKASEWEMGDLLAIAPVCPPEDRAAVLQALPETVRQLVPPPRAAELVRAAAETGVAGEVFDELGVLIREITPGGSARHWVYDATGNTRRYQDSDGRRYLFEHVSWDLCAAETDPLGRSISYQYNVNGLLAAVTDPGGTTTEYVHDQKDRIVEVRRNGELKESFAYDPADNLVAQRGPDGSPLVVYEIGPRNLVAAGRLASGEVQSFEWDDKGHLIRAATDELSVEFAYDDVGNCLRDVREGGGVEREFAGFRLLVRTTVLGRFTTQYRVLPNGAYVVRDPTGRQQVLCFLGDGLVSRTLPDGRVEATRFDAEGRCAFRVTSSNRSARGWTRVFSYSSEGDLLRIDDSRDGTARYEYDPAHQLVRMVNGRGETEEYRYDAAGNLLAQPGLSGATIGSANRIETANGDRFEYDERDRIVARRGRSGDWRFAYDSLDRLVAWTTPDGEEARAAYDPLGRRVWKQTGGRRTEFIWDEDRLAAEIAPDGRLRVYVYADHFAITPLAFVDYDGVDAEPESGRPFYVFSNQCGTPVRVEDERGEVVWQAAIAPYGLAHTDADAQTDFAVRFPGHYWDAETGLHYNRFRYYSPELGRYLQPDPIGLDGGINLYAYTRNPLVEVDVRGDCGGGSRTGSKKDKRSNRNGKKGKDGNGRKPSMPDEDKWKANGGRIINHRDGSKTFIRDDGVKVTYNKAGYPDFSPHCPPGGIIRINPMQGDHYHDFKAANEKLARTNPELAATIPGTGKPPEGYTWHHGEDGKTMYLVPTDIHNTTEGGFPHSGGVSKIKNQ